VKARNSPLPPRHAFSARSLDARACIRVSLRSTAAGRIRRLQDPARTGQRIDPPRWAWMALISRRRACCPWAVRVAGELVFDRLGIEASRPSWKLTPGRRWITKMGGVGCVFVPGRQLRHDVQLGVEVEQLCRHIMPAIDDSAPT